MSMAKADKAAPESNMTRGQLLLPYDFETIAFYIEVCRLFPFPMKMST